MKSFCKFLIALVFALVPAALQAQIVSVGGTDSITAIMSGAAATTNPTYSSAWVIPGGAGSSEVGALNGTSSVAVVAAPSSGTVKEVRTISIYNGDTAAVTVTLRKTVGTTNNILLKQAIPVGTTLIWGENGVSYSTPTAVSNVGTVATVTNLAGSEGGNGVVQKTTFKFTLAPITVRDTQQGGGIKIYDFPEGRILILGATGNANFTTGGILASTLHASVSCRWGVGTVTQANATLATTEQDLLPVTTFTSSATTGTVNVTTTNSALVASAQFDGTSAAKSAFFNISVPGATDIDADAAVTISGTVTITWVYLGDY